MGWLALVGICVVPFVLMFLFDGSDWPGDPENDPEDYDDTTEEGP